MTAPLRGTPRLSAALPASQSATVAEFRCLFTNDIKRKQKRWQDGFLKFHTFNSRVMVYDQSRNHVGDTYWKESNELQEGDELSLDRGVMVEVAEAMGVTQTDLTPLFEKKPRETTNEAPVRSSAATTRPFQRPSSIAPTHASRPGSQLRHKSLNTLLGPSKGLVGKAIPLQSPYEARKEQENEWATERPAKRQKVAQRPSEWRASSPAPEEPSPIKAQPTITRTAAVRAAPMPQLRVPRTTSTVTISSEADDGPTITSDVTLPSTPAGKRGNNGLPAPPVAAGETNGLEKRPPVQSPKIPRGKVPVTKAKSTETPQRTAPTSSPPVSASNRLNNVDIAVQPTKKPREARPRQPSPPKNLKTKALRLSTGVKRGTLLCQALPNQHIAPKAMLAATSQTSRAARKEPSPQVTELMTDDAIAAPLPLKARHAQHLSERQARPKKAKVAAPVRGCSEPDFDDPDIVHGLMDEQLLNLPSSGEHHETQRPFQSAVGTKKTSNVPNKVNQKDRSDHSGAPNPKRAREASPAHSLKPSRKPKEQQAAQKHSLPCAPIIEPPVTASREVSPTHTDMSETLSRYGSASPNKAVLSTGGFRKQQKRNTKEPSEAVTPKDSAPPLPTRNIFLPPHSPRASNKASLMSATELASLLQKPNKRMRTDDPIEEGGIDVGKSPNRSFRRVRSENDAPIPSTAADWERKNLPNPSNRRKEADPATDTLPEPKTAKPGSLAALVKKTDPRKRFQRTKSLNIETNIPPDIDPELPSPVIDNDVGPWSTEAFDLFDWRPPKHD